MSREPTEVAGAHQPDPADRILRSLGRQWRQRRALVGGLVALGVWLPCVALLRVLSGPKVGAFVLATLLASALVWVGFSRWWRARPSDPLAVAAHLDQHMASLEHSGELLAASRATLGPVARMQRARALHALTVAPRPSTLLPALPVTYGLRRLVLGALAAGVIWLWLPVPSAHSSTAGAETERVLAGGPEATMVTPRIETPTIEALVLEIEAPAYTQIAARQVASTVSGSPVASVIEVPDGSRVTWLLTVGQSTDGTSALAAELVLDDRVMAMTADAKGRWRHTERVTEDKVFMAHVRDTQVRDAQVRDAQVRDTPGALVVSSPYARIALVADQPPSVALIEPPLVMEVSSGDAGRELEIRAEVGDDYAVEGTALVATLALGAGEMVQFREQRFALDLEATREDGTLVLRRVLDLVALGLEPGGELYFFVEAWDNHPLAAQRTRSATHVVRWPGGSAGTVSLDSGLPMILPPETFRSQRQIIIDTERLLAERSQLDDVTFADRGRSIAMDQHALRLRYGSMLGDEFVDGRPVGPGGGGDHRKAHHDDAPGSPEEDHPHDHGHAAENGGLAFGAQRFGDDGAARTTRLIDLAGELEGDLVHAHDSEESATFFNTETKRTLKSSLANMWEAELRLHLADPDGALPYEYRALRLLKEVQQASRVYVRRVGFGTPPLDPGRRFSGELDGIRTLRPRRETDPRPDRPAVRRALAALEGPALEVEASPAPAAELAALIDAAAREIANVAAGEPIDLALLEVLRAAVETLHAGRPLVAEGRGLIAAGLWRHLAHPAPVPDRPAAAPSALWQHYRAAVDAHEQARPRTENDG